MFAARLLPPVSSFTRASRKGVTALPVMPCTAASASAISMAPSITARGSACASGTGLAITMPPRRPIAHWACNARAICAGVSSRASTANPLSRAKKAGSRSVP